ncbi:NADP-dependent phosphogluconate dehydrogenase [Tessaracoccus sp. ZS01]|uniref:NADP-dependent phosphogluconate dehydrogenase n=1 Tax=Tessaracoccus sp. ZS01 TaxID=1906324 RepID=UPI00096D4EB5|nr:NADP-dependent phosphogluconate dehydrogenase [Tessaracoccus sp. ZS01]MCG6567460.1 NADP-dependent phosphogluconate dehydrogenase [Tessaracoccus sp. ZS01]OMG57024.1 phosphogluconate dehydrogenase (NADP(+)-dependent, decarboxylating) [Tessaracoccus sp. ZS01]
MALATPTPSSADIGVTGMGVMGSNLARNLARHGHKVAIHNRTAAKTEAVMAQHGDEGTFIPGESMDDFVASLTSPRVAIIMVQAGPATDAVIEELASRMDEGDIIVDCGNALFSDTRRREAALRERGLHFVGCGVSGGEEGALLGPSIMPGGSEESYRRLGPMLESISAHVDGEPCCTHVGADGAGHFVKMVHNGIEYADMQVIGEAYDLLRRALSLSPAEIADIFEEWNKGDLDSYLMEVSVEVLRQVDARTDTPLVDVIVDAAGQKGTGAWTTQTALTLGVPVTGIGEATFARGLSSSPVQREGAHRFASEAAGWYIEDSDAFIEDVRQALYASKLVAYSQGFNLIQAAAAEYDWDISLGDMARIWRAGCIIRARFLGEVTRAYEGQPDLPLLIADKYFYDKVVDALPSWRRVVSLSALHGVPAPVFSSSLSYYDGVRSPRLPAALIQGQRDYFGAHTYKRVDDGGSFHTLWATDERQEVVS